MAGRSFLFILCVFITQICVHTPATAVIIDSGDGSGNTSAPSDDPGWANVGTRAGGDVTVVYLGNRWMLTASHVGGGNVTLGGVDYTQALPVEEFLVPNGDGTHADMVLFRIRDLPPLPALAMPSSSMSATGGGTEVVMIGKGRDRPVEKTYWDSSWVETTGTQASYSGYKTLVSHSMRWGTNKISRADFEMDPICGTTDPTDPSCRPTKALQLVFDSGLSTAHEARANSGDSGGPLFRKQNSGQWELAGIMLAVDKYSQQPNVYYTIYGTATYAADLWYYRDTIQGIIDAHPDSDSDSFLDEYDNCPDDANLDQADTDGDGIGDACDIARDGFLEIIDFEEILIDTDSHEITGDFSAGSLDFDISDDLSYLGNGSFDIGDEPAGYDGSTYFFVLASYDPTPPATWFDPQVTFSMRSGALFDLHRLDLSETLPSAPALAVEIIGEHEGGAEVSRVVTPDGVIDGTGPEDDFETLFFDDQWVDLVQVRIQARSGDDEAAWGIDNIEISYIPEPSLLFSQGVVLACLVALGARSKRGGSPDVEEAQADPPPE